MKFRQTKVSEFVHHTDRNNPPPSSSPLQPIADHGKHLWLLGIPVAYDQNSGQITQTKGVKRYISITLIVLLHYGLVFLWSGSLFMSRDDPMDIVRHYYAVGFSGVDLFAANASNLPNLVGIVFLYGSLKRACAGLSEMNRAFGGLDRRLTLDNGKHGISQ